MVKIKLFNPGSSDTIISEKVAEYSHPILSVVLNSTAVGDSVTGMSNVYKGN